jgi:hypothetical protein
MKALICQRWVRYEQMLLSADGHCRWDQSNCTAQGDPSLRMRTGQREQMERPRWCECMCARECHARV